MLRFLLFLRLCQLLYLFPSPIRMIKVKNILTLLMTIRTGMGTNIKKVKVQ
jgi:hypothetical protein